MQNNPGGVGHLGKRHFQTVVQAHYVRIGGVECIRGLGLYILKCFPVILMQVI